MRRTSSICSSAPGRPRAASSAASSLFTATTDRVRPKTSCRSRENRSRSSATASRACSTRLRSCSHTTPSIQTDARYEPNSASSMSANDRARPTAMPIVVAEIGPVPIHAEQPSPTASTSATSASRP
ncbi:hypothetical protein BJF88_05440 [Cellulosimicrobium sp. CUA-896]|nr:hypothetical protein [Cellulosimicrobium sp. CUA-896]OLT45993.1 hypothetical protein BJF88_05440 [Cellulosimicrobium sp. CUA-896]